MDGPQEIDLGVAVDANNQQIDQTESIPQTEDTFHRSTDDQTAQSIPQQPHFDAFDDDTGADLSEYEDGFFSRVRDVFNEKLNHIGPIEKFYDQEAPVLDFERSLAIIPATSTPSFKNHIVISRLFADDLEFESDEGATGELLSSEIAAINLYTRESHTPLYELLNVQLRKVNRRALRLWMPFLRLLVGGLAKLPREQRTLWRATKGLNLTKYYNKGRKVFWWGFSSCVNDGTIFDDNFFGKAEEKVLFQIEAISAICIQKYSVQPTLGEYLLLPGTFLLVTGVGYQDGKTIIYLQEQEPPFPIFS